MKEIEDWDFGQTIVGAIHVWAATHQKVIADPKWGLLFFERRSMIDPWKVYEVTSELPLAARIAIQEMIELAEHRKTGAYHGPEKTKE